MICFSNEEILLKRNSQMSYIDEVYQPIQTELLTQENQNANDIKI